MAVCVCWKGKQRFLGGWEVISVMWKMPCGDTNIIYMIHYNKVCALGSGCHLNILLAFILWSWWRWIHVIWFPCASIYVWKKLFLAWYRLPFFFFFPKKVFVYVYYLLCKQKKLSTVSVPWWHPKVWRLQGPFDFSRSNQVEGSHSSSNLAEPSCLLWHWYHILKKQIFLVSGQVVRMP